MLNAKAAPHLPQKGSRGALPAWNAVASPSASDNWPAPAVLPVPQNMPVSEVMSTQVVSLAPGTTMEAATQMLLERGISGAPVVDADCRPVGMVSKTDLLEAWQQRGAHRAANLSLQAAAAAGVAAAGGDGHNDDDQVQVDDIMVPYLLAISHQAPISLATALMAYEGVQRLVVLGENSKMVGFVTSLDIVRWLAQLSGDVSPPTAARLPLA